MHKTIQLLTIPFCLLFSAAVFSAIQVNNDFNTASVVNRTGTVIRFMPNENGVWIGLTHGNDSHMFWETSSSVRIRIQGLVNENVYMPICPEIKYINAGETISISVNNPNEERQFYCEVEPAVSKQNVKQLPTQSPTTISLKRK